MCPGCWALREKLAPQQKESETRLQTSSLVLGLISLVPMCLWVQAIAIVVSIVAIVKAKQGPARAARWRAVVGLVCACLGLVATIALAVFSQD